MISLLVRLARSLLSVFARIGRQTQLRKRVILVLPGHDTELLDDILKRIAYYTVGHQYEVQLVRRPPLLRMLFGAHALCLVKGPMARLTRLFPYSYAVDHRTDVAAWDWVRFAHDFAGHQVDVALSKSNLMRAREMYCSSGVSYVFGTGPSLSKAGNRDWSDGFRVVCNTIVRDKELMDHIQPHFIVAGDALYHFSHTLFARQFREDLRSRMLENPGLYFAYPAIFDVVVRTQFADLGARLVPIPTGGPKTLDLDLSQNFALPSLGNVLALLLLPVAFTFAPRVELIGFDGRDPRDRESPFWANSQRHSYPELMWTLRDQFPAFFSYFVPNNDSRKYVQSVHEDLEELFREAEGRGKVVEMLHPSWTETLNRRYRGHQSRETYFYGEV